MTTANRFGGSDGLVITRVTRRTAAAGTWVEGKVGGYCFAALVFPEHADCPEWELGRSRISKLWIQRRADRRMVFNWDRGPDTPATDAAVQALVDGLAAVLADQVYGCPVRGPRRPGPVRATPRRPDRTVAVNGVAFATARQAVRHARVAGREAIRLGGRTLVVQREEAERLAAAGVYFAYLGEHGGRIVTIPVNG
jgi:hypothetical protein